MKSVDRRIVDTVFAQFGLHVVDTDLLQLVDRHRDVDHLVGMADRLGDAVENLAVVHSERHGDAQLAENALDDLHQLHLVQQRTRAHDVNVALVEFAVAAFLRPVGTPDGLDLIPLERQDDLALMLHDVAREGHREVVTQPLFADFRRLPQFVGCKSRRIVARIENLEQQLVALVAVFSQQRGEVFHGGGFERRETEGAEHLPDRVENIVAAHHLGGREVARPLGNRRFLHDYFICFTICCFLSI